jgi:hypothetical protein
MARLFIALGAADNKANSPLFPLYTGRDGDAMRAALAASPYPHHEIFTNPAGYRKHNPHAAANAARLGLAPVASQEAAVPAAPKAKAPAKTKAPAKAKPAPEPAPEPPAPEPPAEPGDEDPAHHFTT